MSVKSITDFFVRKRHMGNRVYDLLRRYLYLDRNWREWDRLHNLYQGRSGFVIGNGPSLKIEDLDKLVGRIAIGSNRIYLAYDQTRFRPTLLTVIDEIVAESMVDELRALPGKKYFAGSLKKILEPMPGAVYWNAMSGALSNTLRRRFSPDARRCLYAGHTVIYNNLQIAYHLGLTTVYLIGMDFSFKLPAKREKHEYAEALVCEGEVNHFIPNYRKPGERWSMPDLERQEAAFISAREYYESNGRRIFNATRGGKLEVFPRVDFDEVISRLCQGND